MYRGSKSKDWTVARLFFYDGNSYAGKTVSYFIYTWIGEWLWILKTVSFNYVYYNLLRIHILQIMQALRKCFDGTYLYIYDSHTVKFSFHEQMKLNVHCKRDLRKCYAIT